MTGYGDGLYGGGTYGGVNVSPAPSWIFQTWDGVAGWVDHTCDVRSIDVQAGRSAYVDAFDASTLEVQLSNPAGIYSTWPPDSIWLQPSGFVTDVPVRVGSLLNGDVHWRFTGTTTAVVDTWPGTTDAIATVRAVDAFASFARHNGGPRPPVGAGELSGARINRLLDDAAYTGTRRIDPGVVAVQATTLDGTTVDLLHQIGEAEWGWLFIDGDGAATFYQRDAVDNRPTMTTVQYVFTDNDAIVGACYGDAVIGADADSIVNIANITPPGLALQSAQNAQSVAWFGPRSWTRTDLPIANTVDALTLAQLIVTEQASDDQRIDAVVIDAAAHPENFPAAHGTDITDRIRFIRTFPGGYQLDMELLVQGRRDHVEPVGDGYSLARWDVTLATATALVIWSLGAWDVSNWDEGQWGV